MRKKPKKQQPNAPQPYTRCVNGIWYWSPRAALRPHWQGQTLGDNFTLAMVEAKRLNIAAEAWYAENKGKKRPPRPRSGPVTIGTLIGLFKASDAWRTLRPRTAKQYIYEFKRLEREFGHDNAATLDEARVDDWADRMRLEAPQTLRHVAAKGRLLYAWAMRKKHVPRGFNPFVGIDLPGARKRKAMLHGHDLKIIVDACDAAGYPSLGTAWVFTFGAIQRITDVLLLRAEHIVPVGNTWRLRFKQSKGQKIIENNQLEGGFDVDMVLPEIIAQRLAQLPAARPALATREGWLMPRESKRPPRRSPLGDPLSSAVRNGSPPLTWDEKEAARAWSKVRAAIVKANPRLAYIGGLQLRDGRRSGFVQHVLDGCTVELVCSMSGHTIEEGYAIVEHYLPKTPEQADKAVGKMSVRL